MPMKRNVREYKSWFSMVRRCYNPADRGYKNYGGRGIRVCTRWLNKFQNFLLDMGPRPAHKTLDRRDNNGNYTPQNCRWATAVEQQRNKRNSRLMSFDGRTLTQAEWAEVTGISTVAMHHRRRLGWSVKDILTVPVDKKKSQHRYWARYAEQRTHCKRGHRLTLENIYPPRRGMHGKDCRKCALFRAIRFRNKQRAVQGEE